MNTLRMPVRKSHKVEFPVADLIKDRKSVRSFSDRIIEQEKIASLFEATRWAPSSTNEQPWFYIYATKDQSALYEKILNSLNEGNRVWAKEAPLLIVSMARRNFTHFVGANTYAMYDLGGANSILSLQAVELGLQVRQMAGYHHKKIIDNLNIPNDYEVGVVMAVGYPGNAEQLPETLKLRELAPRERYIQDEFVMNKTF